MIKILLQVNKKEIVFIFVFRYVIYILGMATLIGSTCSLALISYLIQGRESRGSLKMETR